MRQWYYIEKKRYLQIGTTGTSRHYLNFRVAYVNYLIKWVILLIRLFTEIVKFNILCTSCCYKSNYFF